LVYAVFSCPEVFSQPVIDSVKLNSNEIERYGLLEVSCWIKTEVTDVFNYDKFWLRALLKSPSGHVDTIDGFHFQDYRISPLSQPVKSGQPFWKVRFSPYETGVWSFHVVITDTTGSVTSGGLSFNCSPSGNVGYHSFDGNYLINGTGEVFLPVGENLAWDTAVGFFGSYKGWADSLRENHCNVVKIIMTPWNFGIEWDNTGLGNYTNRLDQAWALDQVIEELWNNGIYVILVPIIQDELQEKNEPHKWNDNPYNAANGGPCEFPWQFFTNSAASEFYKRKTRYLVSRYAHSPNLLAWDLFTEADNFNDYPAHKTQVAQWLTNIARYMRNDLGFDYPLTAGFAISVNDSAVWVNNNISITQLHLYNPPDKDLELMVFSRVEDYFKKYAKPVMVGEFGLFEADTLRKYDPGGIALHNALWTSVMSGSFITALTWFWNDYIDQLGLYYHFKALSDFLGESTFSFLASTPEIVFTLADSSFEVNVVPRYFSLTNKAPSDTFFVSRAGYITPETSALSEVLYGKGPLGQQLRNPPLFIVHYTQSGTFTIKTGEVVSDAILRVKLDNETVFESNAEPLSEYTVQIPDGYHSLYVENIGEALLSVVEVDSYSFGNYAPVLRGFALRNGNSVTGWIKNRLYNWEYLYQHQHPPVGHNGRMLFENFDGGQYFVQWNNCLNGAIDSVSFVQVGAGGVLEIPVQGLVWDRGFTVGKVVGLVEQVAGPDTVACFELYPNPFAHYVEFWARNGFTGHVLTEIFNNKGIRVFYNMVPEGLSPTPVIWDGKDMSGTDLPNGVYLVRMQSGNTSASRKLLKLK